MPGGTVKRLSFTVYCTDSLCHDHPAKYKVAAEWSGGGFSELKTYGFADDECLDRVVQAAKARMARVCLSEGEAIGPIHIYHLDSTRHDYELKRVPELERKYNLPEPEWNTSEPST